MARLPWIRAVRPLIPRLRRSNSTPPPDAPSPTSAATTTLGNGRPDPGEVVWAWVPYEEGDGRGKDRPALVLRVEGERALVLPMTSKDHDRDAAQEASVDRHWMDVGSGAWDKRGRPSEVRLDRQLWVAFSDVRREGAALDAALFSRVLEASAAYDA